MKIVLIVLSISIVVINGNTETCQSSSELESICGNYCFKVVRPVLDHTKSLQSQVNDFMNGKKSLAKLEISEGLIQEQFNFHEKKMEEKLEELRRSNENTLQKKFEVLDKKLENVRRMLEIKESTVGKPFQKIGSKYYYIEQSENFSWFEAVNKCLRLGGHLANIKDQSEFNAIRAKLEPYKRYWIDINDLGTEGIFISGTTGYQANFLNWHPGNPDNWHNEEHCVLLWYKDYEYKMNDVNCKAYIAFICENDKKSTC